MQRSSKNRRLKKLEQRKPRYPFQQPVLIRLRDNSGPLELQGITENASAAGIFLTTYSSIPVGSDVDLIVAMPHNVRVNCHGTVIRVEPRFEEGRIGIAVRCTAPFTEMPMNRST